MSDPARALCEELGRDLADSQEFQLDGRSSVPDVYERLVESGVLEAPELPPELLAPPEPYAAPARRWWPKLVVVAVAVGTLVVVLLR